MNVEKEISKILKILNFKIIKFYMKEIITLQIEKFDENKKIIIFIYEEQHSKIMERYELLY